MIVENSKKSPFVTIGIASYNYERYLLNAFNMIKCQSFTDYEILYCDDGSTDGSVKVIKGIMGDNPNINIRLIQGENLGVMGNKNRIIDNAQGQYIMFCDADDNMLPNCLELLCSIARNSDADQVIGCFRQIDDKGRILQTQHIPRAQSKWTWGAHHGTLYKTSLIRRYNLRFDENMYPDDVYFNMIFHSHCNLIKIVREVIYEWRIHANSVSTNIKNKDDLWHGYPLLQTVVKYIKPIADNYKEEEYQQIEYMAIKMYCLCVLYGSWPDYKRFVLEYNKMHDLFTQAFPLYKNNYYVVNPYARGIVRPSTGFTIFVLVFAEKINLINQLLRIYWIAKKYIRVIV